MHLDPLSPAGDDETTGPIAASPQGDGAAVGEAVLDTRAHTAGAHSRPLGDARVALVHDWLPVYGGAERVLGEMIGLLPESDIFTLIDFVPKEDRAFLQGKDVRTSFIQRLPRARKHYRHYLPLAPLAIESFDLRDYDVVISSSYVVAKGVLTAPDQLHVSYVHSPIRYAWDLQATYLEQAGMVRGPRSAAARMLLHYLRLFDAVSASRVDHFVANSNHVARRIRKTYRRECDVVYPPVDTSAFEPHDRKDSYYVTASRLVPYKRVDLIARAFTAMPDKELIIIGDGPEMRRVKAAAGPNVSVLGQQPFEVVRHYMQHARGFVFAAEEDFGIAPVEAQACGTPVIALGRGGVTETVIDGETGLFFHEQRVESLCAAIDQFERTRDRFDPERARRQAERFSQEHFREAFGAVLEREQRRYAHGGPYVN